MINISGIHNKLDAVKFFEKYYIAHKKQKTLIIDSSNKNDIINILGNPSTTSKFDNDVWIYIERRQTQSELKNLGQMKIFENNVLVLEIDKYGILKDKRFYNMEDMKDIKIEKGTTKTAGINWHWLCGL